MTSPAGAMIEETRGADLEGSAPHKTPHREKEVMEP